LGSLAVEGSVSAALGEESRLKITQWALPIKIISQKIERFQLGIEAQKELFWLNFQKQREDSPKRKRAIALTDCYEIAFRASNSLDEQR
jgi:hypothetical protein